MVEIRGEAGLIHEIGDAETEMCRADDRVAVAAEQFIDCCWRYGGYEVCPHEPTCLDKLDYTVTLRKGAAAARRAEGA